jgi:hypothetical protein
MTNHALEYFHFLVEHKFKRDQYEVTFNKGKYNVVLTITNQKNSSMSYYTCLIYQKNMERCIDGLIRPENFKLQVLIPPDIIKENRKIYHERMKNILRLKTRTDE